MANRLQIKVLKGDSGNRILVGDSSDFQQMQVLGSSMFLSVREGQRTQQLPIPQGQVGIIALKVDIQSHYRDTRVNITRVDFVEVRRQDDSTFVELDKCWIPSENRPGQIVEDRYVQVLIGSEFFTSDPTDKRARFVDADVLCRYLYGDIDGADVKSRATEIQEEKSAKDRVIQLEKIILDELGESFLPAKVG